MTANTAPMRRTLDLGQAAALLKMHPQSVLKKCRAGEIPSAKPGKCWVFIEDDLLEWIRAGYKRPVCPSTEGAEIGGFVSTSAAEKCAGLLGLPARKGRGNTSRS